MDEIEKINTILEKYSHLIKSKNKNLSESTYVGIVELFIKNGLLNHASYFLCQMDRLKYQIPRNLLDLFLDYSVSNKVFESKNEDQTNNNNKFDYNNKNKKNNYNNQNFNKFDDYGTIQDPDYEYFFNKRVNYKNRNDLQNVFHKLNTDSQPYFPKKVEEEQHFEKIRAKLSEIDTSNIKEFIPKNYKVEVKDDNTNNNENNENK
jgi:hypothetical protein